MGKDYQGALQKLFDVTFATFCKSIIVDGSATFGEADIARLLKEMTYLQIHGYVQLREKPKKRNSFTSGLKSFFTRMVNVDGK